MPMPKPALALAAAVSLGASPALADTRIVTTLKPLTLIAQGIATPDMTVSTLVPPGSSPHNYSMKPSQRRALHDADVIFWVGPDMETFLARLLASGEFEALVGQLYLPLWEAEQGKRAQDVMEERP